MPANILNLPDFKVQRVEEADHDYHVYAEVSNPPGVCTACGSDQLAVEDEVTGYGVPDDAMGYGLPPGHFGKAVLTPRKGTPKAEQPHEPPGPPKNYGADINTLIELLESGRL